MKNKKSKKQKIFENRILKAKLFIIDESLSINEYGKIGDSGVENRTMKEKHFSLAEIFEL